MKTKVDRRANHRAYQKKYAKENPDKVRSKELKRHYGITLDFYKGMLVSQGGLCKICSSPPAEKRNLCVDHCHTTDKIRGLLCDKCNKAIGLLNDDPILFAKVIEYLK